MDSRFKCSERSFASVDFPTPSGPSNAYSSPGINSLYTTRSIHAGIESHYRCPVAEFASTQVFSYIVFSSLRFVFAILRKILLRLASACDWVITFSQFFHSQFHRSTCVGVHV